MEIISTTKFNDEYWKAYARLLNEINKRFPNEENSKPVDWIENKVQVLSDLELLKSDLADHYLISDDGKPVGWFARRILGSDANFVFDTLLNNLSHEFFSKMFEELLKFFERTGKEFAYMTAKSVETANSMVSNGAIVTDKMVYSRLMRDQVDERKLRNIVREISKNINYKMVLYNDVTGEIIDRYLELYNDSRIDMNQFNPEKKIIPKRNKESLMNKLKYDKGPDDKMFMYMLFDGDTIAAFSSLYIRKENEQVIDHGGGLTTVNRKYRGKKLAKLLKAKLYLKMLEVYPDFKYIKTDTYPWNKYMYNINEEIGFKPFKEYYELKISKDKIIELLNAKEAI